MLHGICILVWHFQFSASSLPPASKIAHFIGIFGWKEPPSTLLPPFHSSSPSTPQICNISLYVTFLTTRKSGAGGRKVEEGVEVEGRDSFHLKIPMKWAFFEESGRTEGESHKACSLLEGACRSAAGHPMGACLLIIN
jgi:hypothetical protein